MNEQQEPEKNSITLSEAEAFEIRASLKLRTLRCAAVVLATAGLFFLYLYSVHRDVPVVQAASVTPAMNFAAVRMFGEVTRPAYRFASGGIVFSMNDGTGEVSVTANRTQAEALRAAGKMPRRGDRIEAAGSLSIDDGGEIRMRLLSAERLTIFRSPDSVSPDIPPRAVRADELSPALEGETVEFSGILKTVQIPRPGSRAPYTLILADGETEIPVVFWNEVLEGMDRKLPVPGRTVTVRGAVQIYREALQIQLRRAEDFSEARP